MIIDSNETPGGLASTDVTPEGFVSLPPSNCEVKESNSLARSSTMLVAMSSSPTTSTSTTVSMRHCPRPKTGIRTNVFHMCAVRSSGSRTHSRTTSPFCQRRTKSSALTE